MSTAALGEEFRKSMLPIYNWIEYRTDNSKIVGKDEEGNEKYGMSELVNGSANAAMEAATQAMKNLYGKDVFNSENG